MTAIATLPPSPPVAATEEPERVTPEQMLRPPDDGRLYELVDGKLVEKRMSDLAQLVANNINDELVLWARRTGAGRSFVETTYRCFPRAPELVRRPDVSFISKDRLAAYQWGRGHFSIAPDLAVEVVSPHDEVYELDRKITEYFQAGVRRVWVVNPDQPLVRIHRARGDVAELVGDAELADDAVLPGFRAALPAVFAGATRPAP